MKLNVCLALVVLVAVKPHNSKFHGHGHEHEYGNNHHDSQINIYRRSNTNCGVPHYDIKPKSATESSSCIVGGEEATPNSFPWQVSMQFGSYGHICGGSLVRNANGQMVVVTAAQCVDGNLGTANSWTMELGKHSLSSYETTTMSVTVTEIKKHESYNRNTLNNDIAVMILANNTFLESYATSPVCLTNVVPSTYAGKDCVVTGWGTLEAGGSSQDRLRQVYKLFLNQSQCTDAYGFAFNIHTMVCAGAIDNKGKAAGQGDPGGPLVCKASDGAWHLVGVVSWGYGCADSDPGVYANVYNYRTWLSNNMH